MNKCTTCGTQTTRLICEDCIKKYYQPKPIPNAGLRTPDVVPPISQRKVEVEELIKELNNLGITVVVHNNDWHLFAESAKIEELKLTTDLAYNSNHKNEIVDKINEIISVINGGGE
jgi:hypothetical protein